MALAADDLVTISRRYAQRMQRMEDRRSEALLDAWRAIEDELRSTVDALADRIAAGDAIVTPSLLMAEDRYHALLRKAHVEFERFSNRAESIIGADIANAARMANEIVNEMFEIAGVFDNPPTSAVREFVEWTAESTKPLRRLLWESFPDAVDGLTNALVVAIGVGRSPAELATQMFNGFAIGFNRALTISRTEVLRAFRGGQLDEYRRSGVVLGYKRLATHDMRVCLGCLFTDGMMFDVTSDFDAHPNCRCTMVPVIIAVTTPEWTVGSDWFKTLPDDKQYEILGKSRFEMWKRGDVKDVRDFVKHNQDDEWGGAFVPRPIREIQMVV